MAYKGDNGMDIDIDKDKSMIISSAMPFPNIGWWSRVQDANEVRYDLTEHFEKMSYRNKYFITGANGLIQLSIPLQKGREQRTPMSEVQIDNSQRWQVQHWRTIVSVYKRSPYFEYYEPALEQLYTIPYEKLTDLNLASIQWLKKELKQRFEETFADDYVKQYDNAMDLRHSLKPGVERIPINGKGLYYQMFSDKNGFLPNLSMLDLLFAEGPYAMRWLAANGELITGWSGKDKEG